MAFLTALVVTASLVSISSAANISDICSALSAPSCHCSHSSSSASSASVRCTFNTSQTPSPLFPNASFASTVTLDSLDLSGNDLDKLPDDFFHMETIHTLILGDNHFKDIPAVLKKVKAVKNLDLSFNGLKSLSWEVVAGVANLEKLDVSGNQLTALSGDLEGWPSAQLPLLKELRLSRNAISSFNASALTFLSSLASLDLAHNHLSQVTRATFQPFRLTLHSLDLSHNSLTHVDPLAFRTLQEIRELSLAHNDLGKALEELWFPQHLTSMDLRGCGLTSINRCRLSALVDLAVLDLRGNPLECNCDLFFLNQQFQNPGSNASHWSCQRPPRTSTGAPNGVSSASRPSSQSGGSSLSDNGTGTAVADVGGQCQRFYVVCPSVSEMVEQMVTTLEVEGSDDTLTVSWTLDVNDDLRIDGFEVRYIPETGDPVTSDLVASDQRRWVLKTSGLDEHFMVCLDVLMYTSAVVHQECRSFQEDEDGGFVVGIIAGTVFLLPCVVILVVIFVKDSRIHKALYQKVDLFENAEKEHPGSVAVIIGDGGSGKVPQQDNRDEKGDLPGFHTNAPTTGPGVGTAETPAVQEPDEPRAQESETLADKTPSDKDQATDAVEIEVSVHQSASQDHPHAEGIGNLGFRCEGGHEGSVACPDPQHISIRF